MQSRITPTRCQSGHLGQVSNTALSSHEQLVLHWDTGKVDSLVCWPDDHLSTHGGQEVLLKLLTYFLRAATRNCQKCTWCKYLLGNPICLTHACLGLATTSVTATAACNLASHAMYPIHRKSAKTCIVHISALSLNHCEHVAHERQLTDHCPPSTTVIIAKNRPTFKGVYTNVSAATCTLKRKSCGSVQKKSGWFRNLYARVTYLGSNKRCS